MVGFDEKWYTEEIDKTSGIFYLKKRLKSQRELVKSILRPEKDVKYKYDLLKLLESEDIVKDTKDEKINLTFAIRNSIHLETYFELLNKYKAIENDYFKKIRVQYNKEIPFDNIEIEVKNEFSNELINMDEKQEIDEFEQLSKKEAVNLLCNRIKEASHTLKSSLKEGDLKLILFAEDISKLELKKINEVYNNEYKKIEEIIQFISYLSRIDDIYPYECVAICKKDNTLFVTETEKEGIYI